MPDTDHLQSTWNNAIECYADALRQDSFFPHDMTEAEIIQHVHVDAAYALNQEVKRTLARENTTRDEAKEIVAHRWLEKLAPRAA